MSRGDCPATMGAMTMTSAATVASSPHDIKRALVWTLVTVAGACAVAYLALADVAGVTRVAGSTYETEFVNGGWWNLGFALAVPVYLATRASYWFAPAAVLIATVAQLYIADTVVERYLESGWGDGLESLSYAWAIAMGVFFALAAVGGVVVTHVRRRRETQHNHPSAATE